MNSNDQSVTGKVLNETRNIGNNIRVGLSSRAFNDFQFDFINNPLSEIENCKATIIKQIPEYFEIVTGFERNIAYYVFGETSQGYKYLFKCKENTSCLMRYLCATEFRQLNMEFLHTSSETQPEAPKRIANSLKPYTCPCFCLCRPEIFLKLNDSNKNIGRIKEPFSCSEHFFEIYDENDKIKYLIKGKYCQCGLLCANSIFGKIGEVNLNILEPESKEQIGSINKKNPVFSEGVNEEIYKITFPDKASTNDKLLLIALGLMIDYKYFEIDPAKY